jgi:hypothetical protein
VKTVNIYAAQHIRDDDPPRDVTIVIHHPMPERYNIQDARAFFASEAAALANALWNSLPGGTVDALLVALLDRQRSVLVITRGGNE